VLRWVTVLRDEGFDLTLDNYIVLRGRGFNRAAVDRAVVDLVDCGLARLEVGAGWLTLRRAG
jgi:hypothetical protein